MKVLLLGYTGLVGNEILKELLKKSGGIDEVILLGRNFPEIQNSKIRLIKTDFNNLEDLKPDIKADTVICALGATIKKAGSQENFRKVDFEYPYKIAEIAKTNGSATYILISSIGADSKSKAFYTRVKGETEEAIARLQYKSFNVLRPSMILGDRKEFRLGEKMGKSVMGLFDYFIPAKYKAIPASQIAAAAIKIMNMNNPGNNIFESDQLRELSK